jgi:hypothetical protein
MSGVLFLPHQNMAQAGAGQSIIKRADGRARITEKQLDFLALKAFDHDFGSGNQADHSLVFV